MLVKFLELKIFFFLMVNRNRLRGGKFRCFFREFQFIYLKCLVTQGQSLCYLNNIPQITLMCI